VFSWDLNHAGDRRGVLGMAQSGVPVQRVGRPKLALRVLGLLPQSCSSWLRNTPVSEALLAFKIHFGGRLPD
jgi:hypothetical protein